jgi:CubicO group peptidase (beta-lactamase class C family)
MKDTGFSMPAENIARLATSYRRDWVSGDIVPNDPDEARQWATPPAFESGAAGLVSTVDDYHAFARMLLQHGTYNGVELLSPASVELMTTDRLTPEQKQHGGLYPGFIDALGWGFGVSVTTRRTNLHTTPGSYGWFGGLGTSWQNDPKEGVIGILLTQTSLASPEPPEVDRDFWTTAYQAIVD